jgi:hypothetical protein
VEIVRYVVVGVQPGRRDDVDVDLGVDPLNARDVPTQPGDGEVDDGAHAAVLQLLQPLDGVGDPDLFFPAGRIVLHDLGAQHEHVLVHQHLAQIGCVDRAADGFDSRHEVASAFREALAQVALDDLATHRLG